MKANRAFVCGKSREVDSGIVFNRVTARGGGKHGARRRCRAVALALVLQSLILYGALPALAQSEKPVEVKRPELQIGNAVRYDEDWSTLKGVDTSRTDDFWDRLKFIPFTTDQSVWLSIGGQVRERFEYFDQFQWGASAPKRSDAYLAQRIRLNTDLHVTPYFRLFFEGWSALVWNRDLQGGNSTTFVDQADLHNGFAEVMIPLRDQASVTLRGGRQELIFGAQRLVGVSDFTNTRRSFDGATSIVRVGDWTITPFWADLMIVKQYRFNTSSTDNQLFGIYSTGPAHLLPGNLDLYYLGVDNKTAAFNGTSGREKRHTLGLRAWGKIGQNWDFEFEGAGQFGTLGSGDIGAGMVAAILGYTLPVKDLSPRVYLEFDYGSGDKKPGGKVGTFNQLYPSSHGFLGYNDFIGWQNILSPSAGVSLKPVRDLTVSLQQYLFWRASDRDAIYNSGGAVQRPGTGTRARYVGAETDLLATYNFTRHLQGYAGYSFISSGGFIEKTGRDSNSNFVYTALQYTF